MVSWDTHACPWPWSLEGVQASSTQPAWLWLLQKLSHSFCFLQMGARQQVPRVYSARDRHEVSITDLEMGGRLIMPSCGRGKAEYGFS
jgi:hypothetical protein